MKTKNLIFGALALAIVGGSAYFYFKDKNKLPFSTKLTNALTIKS